MRVEDSHTIVTDHDEVQEYRDWFDAPQGEYGFDQVGKTVVQNNEQWRVQLRVNICPNCAVPQRAKTYLTRTVV